MTSWMGRVLLALALYSCTGIAPGAPGGVQAQASAESDLRELVGRYTADRENLERFYSVSGSARRSERFEAFAREWRSTLDGLDFAGLNEDGRIDWILLHGQLERDLLRLARERERQAEIEPLLPFAPRIVALEEARVLMEPLDPERAAGELDGLKSAIEETQKAAEENAASYKKSVANRAAAQVDELHSALAGWYDFRKGYDPSFDWWVTKPYEALRAALEGYAKLLREKLVGLKGEDDQTIVGDPIGREALLAELASAWIPYTPEELIQIAEREFAWCEAELLKASREMGCGDDWKQALERVKEDHVEPGEQPALIRQLALEAIDYVEKNELVTVPPLAAETWRMEMLSPEAQRTSPFFLGGELILVSYPTDGMTHEEKRMSMRGNNRHFARATVHHEVIPGHHLQGFMNERYQPQRGQFSTPFWTEGWALWWEMLLWQRGYFVTPEDRVGALFWRLHRCARIQFSLGFHLGQMTPEQCVDLLVERVGHERKNEIGRAHV